MDDAQVEEIRGFLRQEQRNPKLAQRAFPDLARAKRMREAGGRQEALMRAWLLTELRTSEIAALLGVSLGALEAYVAMYFDVRDRSSHWDWVVSHVLQLHTRQFPSFEQAEFVTWQLEALGGASHFAAFLELIPESPRATDQGMGPEAEIDAQITRLWKYRMHVLLTTTSESDISPRIWQRLYWGQRRLELLLERQRSRGQLPARETSRTQTPCSTRKDGHGFGATARNYSPSYSVSFRNGSTPDVPGRKPLTVSGNGRRSSAASSMPTAWASTSS